MAADAERWFVARDRAAYLPSADALVLADLHLGRGVTAPVDAPFGEGAAAADRLEALVDRFAPATVVVAGDVLHAFSGVPDGVPEALAGVRERVAAAGARLVLVRGNHDTALDSLADPVEEHRLADGETVVCHGHEPPSAPAERYVVGHLHPAIAIERRRRPCFLLGPAAYDGADVLVLPAFDRLAAGKTVTAMRRRAGFSPLVADVDAFHPVVRDEAVDETYVFPPLGSFRTLL